jgi:hypothetical protein
LACLTRLPAQARAGIVAPGGPIAAAAADGTESRRAWRAVPGLIEARHDLLSLHHRYPAGATATWTGFRASADGHRRRHSSLPPPWRGRAVNSNK